MNRGLYICKKIIIMAVEVLNDQSFKDKLASSPLIAVKYYADWCGSCRLFSPKFRRLSENEAYQNISFVDVNAEENPEARKLAGVTSLPFLAVFKEGKMVNGAATNKEELFLDMLNELN